MIADGSLGEPQKDRLELVEKIHEVINGKLVGGGSPYSAQNMIRWVRAMFVWAETSDHHLNLASLEKTYLAWCDSLVSRHQVTKDLSQRSAYTMGAQAGDVFDTVLERSTPLVTTTRLRMPTQRKTARGVKAEKQNLEETFTFGHFLQDICDALTTETVLRGSLPVRIPLRLGGELVEWSGYANWKAVQHHLENEPRVSKKGRERRNHRKSLAKFKLREAEGTLRTRYPLANRRCEAELLIFIGQTGMNFAQAHKLKLRHFHYASHLDGYLVRDRKGRRGGDVLFEIFKEYKPHFERFLEWRRVLFPDSELLFPFVRIGGRSLNRHPQFSLRAVCKDLGLRFVPPQELRNTRVNWLLRRSGDPDLTAAMAQHGKETLLGTYERPSQQRAMVEITRFWAKNDPTIARTSP
ncbi:site-specific integrase [Panacagrimonas sp.]|uniref:site-specific integrase n=1 Tax=Panacagrimonas sp. TaxID=2480088 RepID=UPI003B51BF17